MSFRDHHLRNENKGKKPRGNRREWDTEEKFLISVWECRVAWVWAGFLMESVLSILHL